jgi:hypothetical protein
MVVVAMAGLVACGDDDDTDTASGGASADATEFLDVVKASLEAENAKDTDAFLALWTDKGLEEYDVGSRQELEAGESENFGSEKIDVRRYGTPEVDGDTASVEVDATVGEHGFVMPLYRVVFSGVNQGEAWKLDGFEFKGGPPPADDATVVALKAMDYAFQLSEATVPPGEVAFDFSNAGKEQHELTMFKAPDGVALDDAKATLENVDGSELEDIPDGYEAAHVGFLEVDQNQSVAFAEPLAAGTYVLACYIPQGGFGDEGPVNPEGKPHIQLGMINLLTVE